MSSLPSFLPFTLGILALLIIGGQLYLILTAQAKRRLEEEELAEARQELEVASRSLKQAEREASRLRQVPKAELLSMLQLAHELRSPLASIQCALDMLLQGYAKSNVELQDEMLGLARNRAVTMLDQVNDFLRLGAVQHSEIDRRIRPVQLLDIVQRLIPEKRVRARWRAVDFRVQVPDTLSTVKATPEDIEHLLSNLINNAIKYSNPGGTVTVYLKEDERDVVGVVEDTGIGIAPEDQARIFEEFYRSEAAKEMDVHGTGLGLTIVKRVLDLFGGRIRVESQVGKGSRFTFAFPKVMDVGEPVAERQAVLASQAAREGTRRRSVMERQEIKVFRDLQNEVIFAGLCGKCGGCVSFCSAGRLHALEIGDDDLPRYADERNCLACGICYMICPSTHELDAEVQETFGWRAPVGVYRSVRSARTTDAAVREAATDGGVVTSLLLYMLDRHLVDGALVSRKTAVFGRQPLIATTREALIDAAGSHFGGSAHLEELGTRYTTYSPTISAVKGLESEHLHRTAMVGTPCQIKSARKMQCLGILPAHIINYTIGLFCMENFVFDEATREKLEGELGIDFADVVKLNVKEDVIISLEDGRTIHVPFEQVDEMARPACLACTEFANDYADLSVGGLGSPSGYTTVLIRTEKGNRIYQGALSSGYIEERSDLDAYEMRQAEADLVDKVVDFSRRKRTRGIARLAQLGVEGGVTSE